MYTHVTVEVNAFICESCKPHNFDQQQRQKIKKAIKTTATEQTSQVSIQQKYVYTVVGNYVRQTTGL